MSKKVLVVEDSPLVQKVLQATLQAYSADDIEVHIAGDGVEGLSKLNENPDTDLILLDVNMPRMSGLEFLAKVREESAFDAIKVVLQSTEDHQDDVRRGMEAGANGYLSKPFTAPDLHALLDEMFARA